MGECHLVKSYITQFPSRAFPTKRRLSPVSVSSWRLSISLKYVFKNIVPEFKIVNYRIIILVQTMLLSEAGVQRVIFGMIKIQRPELFARGNFNEATLWKRKTKQRV